MRFTKLSVVFLLFTILTINYLKAESAEKSNLKPSTDLQSDSVTTDLVETPGQPSTVEIAVDSDPLDQDFEFENLVCDQASKSKCERIKKEARFKVGQKVSDKDLKNAKIRIQLLGLFKDVNLNLKKGSKKGKVIIAVETSDRSPIYTILGMQAGARTLNENIGLAANTDFTVGHRDLFGMGKNLSLSGRGWGGTNSGESGSLLLRFSDPNIINSPRWFYNVELFTKQNRFNDYDADTLAVSLELGHRYGDFSYWTIGHVNSATRVHKHFEESGTYFENNLILGYGYNTQDDLYFPTSGTRINLKVAFKLDSEIKGSLSEGSYSSVGGNFDWRTTSRIDDRMFITWFIEGRNNLFEQDDFLNNGIGFELGYQTVRNRKGTDISDMRYYIAPSITDFWAGPDDNEVSTSLNMGVKFRSKEFGLVRLGAFWGHQ